jgi:hypothetical protein
MYKIFEKVVDSDFSGSVKTCLLVLVRCITNCPAYFAEKLHTSLTAKGKLDKDLIRMIVTRSENDLGDIKIAFQQKYNKSLMSFVEVTIY